MSVVRPSNGSFYAEFNFSVIRMSETIAVNWVFTLNNPTPAEIESLKTSELSRVRYLTFGEEVGESGTFHLQGYLELFSRCRMSALKSHLSIPRVHLEVRRGTQQQAIQYCHKDGKVFERGVKHARAVPAKMPSKNKLLPYFADVKTSLVTFSSHPECSMGMLKHAKDWISLNESPRSRALPLEVIWLWGSTGVGKTRLAFDWAESLGHVPYVRSGSAKWFDGYEAHSFVVFDDFRDSHFEFSYLLRLLDRYPLRVEVKGGYRQWKPSIVVITAPYPPKETYKSMQSNDTGYDKHGQLLRRINSIFEITSYNNTLENFIPLLRGQGVVTPPRLFYPVPPPVLSPDLQTPKNQIRRLSTQSPIPRSLARRFSPTQAWQLVSSDSE